MAVFSLSPCGSATCTQRRLVSGASQRPRRPVGRQAQLVVRSTAAVEPAAPAEAPEAVGIEKTSTAFKAVMDIEQIKAVLPHRYPFLLVDRVVELEAQKYAVGYKNVTANDQFFNGHFPERAIMPGVLQVEALAQLGGLVMIDPSSESEKNNFFFGGLENVRWRKPVVPGDTLVMRVELSKFNKRFGIAKMSGKAYVGADLVCEAELTLVMGK